MTSHSLLTRFGHVFGSQDRPRGLRFLHRFSDSVLHTALMVCLALLVGLVLYEAITLTVNIWRFDTVVVEGRAAATQTAPAAPVKK